MPSLRLSDATVSAVRQLYGEEGSVRHAPRRRVITLCGSTRYWDAFIQANTELTLEGNVVFSVATPSYGGGHVTPEQKMALDSVHREKIRLSDEIFVLNVDGYIGESTRSEIEFARSLGKRVVYLEGSGDD